MGKFAGLKDAKRGFQSNPLREDGKYVVRIEECSYFETETSGERWKNTLQILAVVDGPRRVGEVVNTFFNRGQGKVGKDVFMSNVKSFIAGVMDADDDAVGEEEADLVLSDDQTQNPLKGMVTVLTVRMRTSKDKKDEKTGEPLIYPVYSWSPSLNDDEIRAAIGEEAVKRFFPNGL